MTSFLWSEKYRPDTVDSTILPERMKKLFRNMIDEGEIQNMLFFGASGLGKTTVARAIAKTLEADVLFINGSEDSGIDVLRTTIRQFASTVSLGGGGKIVIIDEADGLNPNSTQKALRAFIEEFSDTCRFILTCNNRSMIIDAIESRLIAVDFTVRKDESAKLAAKVFNRTKGILTDEGVTFTEAALAELVKAHFPDIRKTLEVLQVVARTGSVTAESVGVMPDADVLELVPALKAKNFDKLWEWVIKNPTNDYPTLMRRVFDGLFKRVENVPELVIIINEYSYKSAFVVDQELNFAACLTEIMASCRFK